MKKIIICTLMLVLLCGCTQIPDEYSFQDHPDTIVSIELLHNQNEFGEGTNKENMVLIKELNEEEIDSFMSAVCALPTGRTGTPPPWGYGEYIAKVSYTSGDIEILGSMNIEFIPSGNEPTGVGSYHFLEDSFEKLFHEYANLDEGNGE